MHSLLCRWPCLLGRVDLCGVLFVFYMFVRQLFWVHACLCVWIGFLGVVWGLG